MPSHNAESPLARASRETARQTDRARRAEAVRLHQRALLLDLIAGALRDLRISFSELHAAQRNLQQDATQSGRSRSSDAHSDTSPAR